MATLPLIVPNLGAGQRIGNRTKVAMTNGLVVVTFDIVNPEVLFEELAGEWVQVKRPGRRPYLARAGQPLRTIALEATIGNNDLVDRTGDIVALQSLAALEDPVLLAYSVLEVNAAIARSSSWTITTLTLRVTRRRQGDNAPVRAKVTLTLTETSTPPRSGVPGSASMVVPSRRAIDRSTAGKRYVTVGAGETLWSVASRVYGDGGRWRDLADANGIVDPNDVSAGAVLVVP